MHAVLKWILIAVAGAVISTVVGHLISPEMTKQAISLPLTRVEVPVWGLVVSGFLIFLLCRIANSKHATRDLTPTQAQISAARPEELPFSAAESAVLAYMSRAEISMADEAIAVGVAEEANMTRLMAMAALKSLYARKFVDFHLNPNLHATYSLTHAGFNAAAQLAERA